MSIAGQPQGVEAARAKIRVSISVTSAWVTRCLTSHAHYKAKQKWLKIELEK